MYSNKNKLTNEQLTGLTGFPRSGETDKNENKMYNQLNINQSKQHIMQKFLRTFVMTALLFVPWITQAQNANVSEYDYAVSTANFASIVVIDFCH